MTKKNTIIITGVAGFIGSSLAKKFIKNGYKVIGIDNLNDYYDVNLKIARLNIISPRYDRFNSFWNFHRLSIENYDQLNNIFEMAGENLIVVNLAAQAGVRYSLENPNSYIQSNLVGFGNILEMCRKFDVNSLVYGSSSSVYGGNTKIPFQEKDQVNHPISLYAATKKSNELMAHSYSHLFNIKSTGLRFFTVYGPWGRPDMAPMIFAKAILAGEPINIFNNGLMKRDFTFIDDIVESIYRCCLKPSTKDTMFDSSNPDPSSSFAPHRIFNVGFGKAIDLDYFITLLEENLGKKCKKIKMPMQAGDVVCTNADTTSLQNWIDFKPNISVEKGVEYFSKWYKKYFT